MPVFKKVKPTHFEGEPPPLWKPKLKVDHHPPLSKTPRSATADLKGAITLMKDVIMRN